MKLRQTIRTNWIDCVSNQVFNGVIIMRSNFFIILPAKKKKKKCQRKMFAAHSRQRFFSAKVTLFKSIYIVSLLPRQTIAHIKLIGLRFIERLVAIDLSGYSHTVRVK